MGQAPSPSGPLSGLREPGQAWRSPRCESCESCRCGGIAPLPRIYCARIPVPFTPPKPIAPTPEELRGSTVLVVDDERAWRVILETDLKMLGYRGSIAEAGDPARVRAVAGQREVAVTA